MPMSCCGISDTGLLIADEIAAYIVLTGDREDDSIPEVIQAALNDGTFRQKVLNKDREIPRDYRSVSVAHEFLEGWNCEPIYHSEFTGSAVTLHLPGDETTIPRTWDYDGRTLSYIPTRVSADLFKPAYDTPKELIQEFRDKLSGILPEDFDLRPYIVKVGGTYFA